VKEGKGGQDGGGREGTSKIRHKAQRKEKTCGVKRWSERSGRISKRKKQNPNEKLEKSSGTWQERGWENCLKKGGRTLVVPFTKTRGNIHQVPDANRKQIGYLIMRERQEGPLIWKKKGTTR